MNKKTIIALIVAGCMVAGGFAVSAVRYFPARESMETAAVPEALVAAAGERSWAAVELEGIVVETASGDIELLPGTGDNIALEFSGSGESGYTIRVEDGELHIRRGSGVGLLADGERDVTLRIPADWGGDVEAVTASGSVSVTGLALDEVLLNSVSGSVDAANVAAKELASDTVSGSVTLENVSVADSLRLGTVSGSLTASLTGDPDGFEIDIETISGSVDAPSGRQGAKKSIDVTTVSGSVSIDFPEE